MTLLAGDLVVLAVEVLALVVVFEVVVFLAAAGAFLALVLAAGTVEVTVSIFGADLVLSE